MPGGIRERDDIPEDVVMNADLLERFAHRQEVGRIDHLLDDDGGGSPVEAPAQHLVLIGLGEVPQSQAEREPVQLRLG